MIIIVEEHHANNMLTPVYLYIVHHSERSRANTTETPNRMVQICENGVLKSKNIR